VTEPTPKPAQTGKPPISAASVPADRNIPESPRDEELERERLEPGLDTGGKGDVGARPGHSHDHDNGNT
jgi:hypothetical protein